MRNEKTLRRLAVALFVIIVAVDLGYVIVASRTQLEVGEAIGVVAPGAVGLVLAWFRPRNPIGWLISAAGLSLGLCDLGQAYGTLALTAPDEHLPLGTLALSLSAPLWIFSVFIPASLLLVRYPTGSVSGRWPRAFDRAALVGLALVYVGYAGSAASVTDEVEGELPPILLPEVVAGVLLAVGSLVVVGGTVAIVVDAIRRAVKGQRAERMALVWLMSAAVLALVFIFFGPADWLGSVAYFGVLVAVAVGVLRYRALGIEVVLRRTLVYSILTSLVLLVFVTVVTVVATVAPRGPLPQVVAAVIVAVGLGPARERVQNLIDHLLYGERDDPFAALQRLGAPMGSETTAVLPAVLDALADALQVESATIDGPGGDGVPLVFGGIELGTLSVTPRRGENSLAKADVRLLESIAPLVAAVVHGVRLADDLRVERSRVVEATQAERSRLRQELHDGLGPSLTGIGLGLEALQRSGADGDMVARLRTEVSSSLEEVRRIIDDLSPFALDGQDLLGALRRRAEQIASAGGIAVDLDAPARIPDLPSSVSAAAFRITDEALTNVVRHSGARHCHVLVEVGERLRLEITDDGIGPGAARDGGVGLASMRDRAERLGGCFSLLARNPGTTVVAELPLVVTA